MSNLNPEPEKDIPEAKVEGKRILLGSQQYDLIMCYECPICNKPIIAYWQLPHDNNRATANVVERALRDSGFGGFRFFSTANGQGFEYDNEKDPRHRHQHSETEQRSVYSYGPSNYTIMWVPFIKLNPIFSVNDFLSRCLDPHNSEYKANYPFIVSQTTAMRFISEMGSNQSIFKISKDIMKHGKPLFWFNLVKWDDLVGKLSWSATTDKRLALLREWFSEGLLDQVKLKEKEEEE